MTGYLIAALALAVAMAVLCAVAWYRAVQARDANAAALARERTASVAADKLHAQQTADLASRLTAAGLELATARRALSEAEDRARVAELAAQVKGESDAEVGAALLGLAGRMRAAGGDPDDDLGDPAADRLRSDLAGLGAREGGAIIAVPSRAGVLPGGAGDRAPHRPPA